MSKKVVFKISPDGNVAIDSVEGYGDTCKDFTKFIEKALGTPDESTRKMTDEYEKDISQGEERHVTN